MTEKSPNTRFILTSKRIPKARPFKVGMAVS